MSGEIGAVGGMGVMGGMAGMGAGMSSSASVSGMGNMSGVKSAGNTIESTPNSAEPSCEVKITQAARQAVVTDPVNPGTQNSSVVNEAHPQVSSNIPVATSQTESANPASTFDPSYNAIGQNIKDMNKMDEILLSLVLAMMMQEQDKNTPMKFSPN